MHILGWEERFSSSFLLNGFIIPPNALFSGFKGELSLLVSDTIENLSELKAGYGAAEAS